MTTGDCRLCTGVSAIALSAVGGLSGPSATASVRAWAVSPERE